VFRRDAFLDHLGIGAVGAVRLAHGVQELLGGNDAGVAIHIVGTAGGRHAAVGTELGVVLDQLDAVGGHAQGLERLQRHHQRADVAPLAHVLPGVVLGDGVVGIELQGDGGAVGGSFRDVESAPRETYAAAQLGRVVFPGLLYGPLVEGPHLGHHLFHGILLEWIAVDVHVAGARDVAPAELEGVDAGLFCQHVHQRLAQRVRLRRAVAAIGDAKVVVRIGNAHQPGDVWHLVGKEREAGGLGHEIVAAPGVGAVIQAEIEFGGRDEAVLVAGDAPVGVAGAALAGKVLVLLVAHRQRHRHLGDDGGGSGQADVAGVGRPAKTAPRGVQDDAQLVLGYADRVAHAPQGGIDALGLALDRQVSLVVIVGLDGVALDGEVRLTGRVETALHAVGRVVDDLGHFRCILQPHAL